MKNVHNKLVFNRRVRVLSRHLAERLPQNARVLDIGCGSGDIAVAILAERPDLTMVGVDVLVRAETAIKVERYDGKTIPFGDDAYDFAMLVDVLHHTDDPAAVMAEANRVASKGVLIKDHYKDGPVAGPILRFMDWVGNSSHGVRLPYNYLSREEWAGIWRNLGLKPIRTEVNLGIYPMPFDLVFGQRLHFVTVLTAKDT